MLCFTTGGCAPVSTHYSAFLSTAAGTFNPPKQQDVVIVALQSACVENLSCQFNYWQRNSKRMAVNGSFGFKATRQFLS